MPDLEDFHVYDPEDPRLKRHVAHDPRSRDYPLPSRRRPRRHVRWERTGPILDQNVVPNGHGGYGVGCCTACAGVGLLMTGPFATEPQRIFTIKDALAIYHDETVLDEHQIPGVWPPTDTGSSGLWLMKVLRARGYIAGYRHAFSLDSALGALGVGPIAVGTVWLQSMFDPGPDHVIRVDTDSQVAGGHEWLADEWDPAGRGWVGMTNSWSEQWGDHGRAYLSVDDFGWLLRQRGDVVQPVGDAA